MKQIFIFTLALLILVSALSFSSAQCFGYNTKDCATSSNVNNNTLNVSNAQTLQGLTPQQVANLYSETDPLFTSWYNSGNPTLNSLIINGQLTSQQNGANPMVFQSASNLFYEYPFFNFKRSRGTLASQTPVANGDILGGINFYGNLGGGSSSYTSGTGITASVNGVANGWLPTRMDFSVTNDTSATSQAMLTINSSQVVNKKTYGLYTEAGGDYNVFSVFNTFDNLVWYPAFQVNRYGGFFANDVGGFGQANNGGASQILIQNNGVASRIGEIIKGGAGQTGDLEQWQDVYGNTLANVNNNGTIYARNILAPYSWWKLQINQSDNSGNGNTLTNNQSMSFSGGYMQGKANIPNKEIFNGFSNMTFVTKFRNSDPTQSNSRIMIMSNSTTSWAVIMDNGDIYDDKLTFYMGDSSANSGTGAYNWKWQSSTTYNDDTLHQLILVASTSGTKFYIDGVQVAGNWIVGSPTTPTGMNRLISPTGFTLGEGNVARVKLRDTYIFNRSLSDYEIKELYNYADYNFDYAYLNGIQSIGLNQNYDRNYFLSTPVATTTDVFPSEQPRGFARWYGSGTNDEAKYGAMLDMNYARAGWNGMPNNLSVIKAQISSAQNYNQKVVAGEFSIVGVAESTLGKPITALKCNAWDSNGVGDPEWCLFADRGDIRLNSTYSLDFNGKSKINYNGSDMIIKSNVVGSGKTYLDNNVVITGNLSVKRPYWHGYDNTTQPFLNTANTQVINFSTTDDSWLINLVGKTNFTFKQTGDYTFTLQPLFTTGVANKHVEFWIEKNGVDVPASNTRIELSNVNVEVAQSITYQLDCNTTDIIRFKWWSDSTSTQLLDTPIASTPTRPEVPSVILNIQKVSELTP